MTNRLEGLEDEIGNASSFRESDGAFTYALTAAFAKSISFVGELTASGTPATSFWLAPVLRSICEDFIVLGYIDQHLPEDRDEVITLLLHMDTYQSLHAQADFFAAFRPFQPIVKTGIPKNEVKRIKKRLREINLEFISNADSFRPSVRAMAKSQGLLPLYDYLYNASSRLVHFSPGTLLRMAWGAEKVGEYRCAPNAMEKYYADFTRFYGVHLLAALTGRFEAQLQLPDELRTAIDALVVDVNALHRWPELVTFEELNRPNPWADEKSMRRMSFWSALATDPGAVFAPRKEK